MQPTATTAQSSIAQAAAFQQQSGQYMPHAHAVGAEQLQRTSESAQLAGSGGYAYGYPLVEQQRATTDAAAAEQQPDLAGGQRHADSESPAQAANKLEEGVGASERASRRWRGSNRQQLDDEDDEENEPEDAMSSSYESELADRVRALREEADADEETARTRRGAAGGDDESTDSEAELQAYARDATANDDEVDDDEDQDLDYEADAADGEDRREGTSGATAGGDDSNWLVRRYNDSPTDPEPRAAKSYNV